VKPKNVVWVPSPPKTGIVSMFRYWEELKKAYSTCENSQYKVDDLVHFKSDYRRRGRIERGIEKYIELPLRAASVQRCDVMHGLAHDAGSYMRYAPRRVSRVVTVHDIIPLVCPQDITKPQLRRFKSHLEMLSDMDMLVAVSSYTAKELQRHLGIEDDRIRVIPNGVNAAFFSKVSAPPKAIEVLRGKPYILSVSSALKRKNLEILPQFFDGLKSLGVNCALVRAGSSLPEGIRGRLHSILGDDLIEVGRCSDVELAGLYQNAELFVFPSLYEGFGLPILEAMAASCPVISSCATSLPEVAGEGVELFDPHNVDAMVNAAVKVFENKDSYTEYGLSRVREFTWESHLRGLFDIYNEVI
jgi:glycosyltransferase involved in cell wall biosynthesis